MNTGLLQPADDRPLITPEPYSPPMPSAAFFTDGMTATHWARFHSSSGMPFSGASRSSVTTVAPSWSRFTSSFDNAADETVAIEHATAVNVSMDFMCQLSPDACCNADARGARRSRPGGVAFVQFCLTCSAGSHAIAL